MSNSPLTPPRILIVDDLPAPRELLAALLKPEGYVLQFATNGAEALQLAAECPPDLILLDVMMPGMDGFEVCQRLRATPSLAEVPIILLTALDDRASRLRGFTAGADDFISKPYDQVELRTRVRGITRLNRYRSLLAQRAEFEWVVEQSAVGILVVERDDTVRYANPRAVQVLDLPTTQPPLVGSKFLDAARCRYRLIPELFWQSWSNLPDDPHPAVPLSLAARDADGPRLLAPRPGAGCDQWPAPSLAGKPHRNRDHPAQRLDLPERGFPQAAHAAQRTLRLSGRTEG